MHELVAVSNAWLFVAGVVAKPSYDPETLPHQNSKHSIPKHTKKIKPEHTLAQARGPVFAPLPLQTPYLTPSAAAVAQHLSTSPDGKAQHPTKRTNQTRKGNSVARDMAHLKGFTLILLLLPPSLRIQSRILNTLGHLITSHRSLSNSWYIQK